LGHEDARVTRERTNRKTKLIATIGPACDTPQVLEAMIRAGMNVARLNFSHGSHDEHGKRLEMIREVSSALGANVAIMIDTKGVEIRTGALASGPVELLQGEAFELRTDDRAGDGAGVAVTYDALPECVEPGAPILLDDGAIELRVARVTGNKVACRVVRGGTLRERRGVNLPGTRLPIPVLSPENRADLDFAIEHDVVYVAASFMRTGDDVRQIRRFLDERAARISIIAKIENAEGVANLDEIVAAADGIMVARGDLGVEIPVQEVPIAQKRIIRTTVMNGKPVITATQMLDSMERNPLPTRAEVTDVANAILDGTSAVMLSGETAIGSHPVAAVRTMAMLALEAEASLTEFGQLQNILPEPSNVVTEAVSQASITMARHIDAAAILALTETGFTARSISKYRPACPILGVTAVPEVARRFAMNWGVTGVLCDRGDSNQAMIDHALQLGLELGYFERGDHVVVTAGMHGGTGTTDMIRVVHVD
jgi:pyruvate kinase